MNKKWTTEEDNKLKELINDGYNSGEIGILMNRPKNKVQNHWQHLGFKRPRPLTNESFFSIIDTEAKAYFLGLMFSDGCVNIPKLNYDNKPMIKTSKYKYISYRKQETKKWQIIKYNRRKMFCLGKYDTEFDAFIGLCEYEQNNKLQFSNNPEKYLKFIQSSS